MNAWPRTLATTLAIGSASYFVQAVAEELPSSPPPLSDEEKGLVDRADELFWKNVDQTEPVTGLAYLEKLDKAIRLLPDHPRTEPIKQEYRRRFIGRGMYLLEEGKIDRAEFAEVASKTLGNQLISLNPNLEAKRMLKRVIIPKIEFTDTPLKEALDTIDRLGRENAPEGTTFDFVIRESDIVPFTPNRKKGEASPFGGRADPSREEGAQRGFGANESTPDQTTLESIFNTRITLRLSNAPMSEALRYTTSLAGLRYHFEQTQIIIGPLSTICSEAPTTVNQAPECFLVNTSRNARDLLESLGFHFNPGASAILNRKSNQLIVRLTQSEMDKYQLWLSAVNRAPDLEHLCYEAFLHQRAASLLEEEGISDEAEASQEHALKILSTLQTFYPGFFPDFIETEVQRVKASLSE